jgi:integrase
LTLTEFASLSPQKLEGIAEVIAGRVLKSRPWVEGRHTGNHCVAALRMTWEFARRRGWIVKDPLREVDMLDAPSAKVYLEDIDLAAVGVAVRGLEELATRSLPTSRQGPALTSLLALRVAIYTGCRHREELVKGKLSWLRWDYSVPRIEIPRAKGDRGTRQGRFVYLGPDGACAVS